MTEKVDKRKILSEEQLERLKLAREKANEVRAKKALVKKAEKDKQKKEMDEKYNELVREATPLAQNSKPPSKEEDVQEEAPITKPKRKTTKVIEIDSDETSSDSSSDDSEYDITPVKERYKEKYKHKYANKYNKPYDPLADITTIAKHNLSNKVSEELRKMAFQSLFG